MSFWIVTYECSDGHKWNEQDGIIGTTWLGPTPKGICPECKQKGKIVSPKIDNPDKKHPDRTVLSNRSRRGKS